MSRATPAPRASTFRYRLAPHVHACQVGAEVVLLDLHRDRYLAVGRPDMHTLAGLIERWPHQPGAAIEEETPAALHNDMIEHLRLLGMLTPSDSTTCPKATVAIPRPQQALIEGYIEIRPRLGLTDFVRFARAATAAATHLRWGSLAQATACISSRHRRTADTAWDSAQELSYAQIAVAKYLRLRPWFFSARKACLLDSLALSGFLAYYGCLPLCVFGVRTRPFSAHCWLQQEDIVFNDSVEHAAGYTPIAVF